MGKAKRASKWRRLSGRDGRCLGPRWLAAQYCLPSRNWVQMMEAERNGTVMVCREARSALTYRLAPHLGAKSPWSKSPVRQLILGSAAREFLRIRREKGQSSRCRGNQVPGNSFRDMDAGKRSRRSLMKYILVSHVFMIGPCALGGKHKKDFLSESALKKVYIVSYSTAQPLRAQSFVFWPAPTCVHARAVVCTRGISSPTMLSFDPYSCSDGARPAAS